MQQKTQGKLPDESAEGNLQKEGILFNKKPKVTHQMKTSKVNYHKKAPYAKTNKATCQIKKAKVTPKATY